MFLVEGVVAGVASTIAKYATQKAVSSTSAAEEKPWEPEGPTTLTELWMLTVLPSGTKIHFSQHHIRHVFNTGIIPQAIIRWNANDKKEQVLKIKTAIEYTLSMFPPNKDENSPLDKFYIGARDGLFRLGTTYGFELEKDLKEKERKTSKPEIKLDKTEEEEEIPALEKSQEKPLKLHPNTNDKPKEKSPLEITHDTLIECIELINSALKQGVVEGHLRPLGKAIQENWTSISFAHVGQEISDIEKFSRDYPLGYNNPSYESLRDWCEAKIKQYVQFSEKLRKEIVVQEP